jgi:hypothetical protein
MVNESSSNWRKLVWPIVGVGSVILALAGPLDSVSRDYAEAAFARSLVTFALARTLNGAISVAQGTEVAVEPGGVGVNFALGEALDPINDLVERFSVAMLVATSSLGLQNILLRMTSWWGTSLVLAAAAILLLVALWRPALVGGLGRATAIRVLLVCIFLRFAVPVFVIGSNLVFDVFLAAEHETASQALADTGREIQELSDEAAPPPADEEQSLAERFGSLLDGSLEALDVRSRIEQLSQRVSNAVEQVINLIVIFVLQTIVLPLAFLWLFAEFLKAIASRTTKL